MRNIKLVLEYDGTNYNGFQVQEKTQLPTIQGVLEDKLSFLAKQRIRITGAGRTDAGVHAKGQVVNFRSQWNIPIEKVSLALNSILPKDIAVKTAEDVGEEFHARFDARGKSYRYRIYNNRIPSVFDTKYSWFIPYFVDLDKMIEGSKTLFGEHDFTSFRASGSVVKDSIRTIYNLDLKQKGPIIELTISGNGFLYNMVRIIAGTLVEVGRGKLTTGDVKRILEAKDRKEAGPTAPPHGLFLMDVFYD